MCAILGWSGKLPVGLLTQLFLAAEHRGHDSTGVAYNSAETEENILVKQAIRASQFVDRNQEHVKKARLSDLGIAHTRRASKGMPIDNINAHPFIWNEYHVFAHNGVVRNWKELKPTIVKEITEAEQDATSADRIKYVEAISTDSMVLGYFIENLDFSKVEGCFGLVWLFDTKLYCFRSKKELTAATIKWSPENKPEELHEVTVVASTWEIIANALDKIKNCKFECNESILTENTLYEVKPGSVINDGEVKVSPNNQVDMVTSIVD